MTENPPSEHAAASDHATTAASDDRFFITTAIPYVNARPHIGFALEIILTDALARYHRLRGEDVLFLTGTDENSLKNVQAAEREGMPTQELVDRNSERYLELRGPLNLSFNDFIRTSNDPRHIAGVRKLWEACAANGDIYTKSYRGLYCVGCELFYTEEELDNGCCRVHGTPVEVVEEENYFFRLSRYQDDLLRLIESNELRITPQTRRNEVLSFIRMGLADFSISRSQKRARGWGITVPGDENQVMYVWFDALGNYITALGYADDAPAYERYWTHNPHRVHVIGKDISRFHCVYWPAMLLSAHVRLPSDVLIHGFMNLGGTKISKSAGNVLDPVELCERYGTDALRYYLLREIPTTDDGDFTLERFVRSYNTELADQLGNLLNRTVSMIGRYFGGTVPAPGEQGGPDGALIELAGHLPGRVAEAMARYAVDDALDAIFGFVGAANKYIADAEPWVVAKQRKTDPAAERRLGTILYTAAEALRLCAYYCQPYIPASAAGVAEQLGLDPGTLGTWEQATRWGGYPAGTQVRPGSVLFPKHEVPEEAPA